jgi:hypothetical protein
MGTQAANGGKRLRALFVAYANMLAVRLCFGPVRWTFLGIVAALAPARPVWAQSSWTERAIITPADETVSYSGIARKQDRMLATAGGRVDVLSRSSGSWEAVATIEPVETTHENFGGGLALDGVTAVVADPGRSATDIQGSVHVFAEDNSEGWRFVQKLVPPDSSAGDRFGLRMALEGDTLIVAAPHKDFDGLNVPGRAYAFSRSAGSWQFQQIIPDPAPHAYNWFGSRIALRGETLLIGVPDRDVDGVSRQGAVYVYTRTAGVWSLAQRLVAPDGDGLGFGVGVALDEEMAIIGANVGGGPYVFRRSTQGWEFAEKLEPSLYFTGTGSVIAMDGDTVFIASASATPGPWPEEGLVFAFDRAGGIFTEQQVLRGSIQRSLGYFGVEIGLFGNDAIIRHSEGLFEFVRSGGAGAGGAGSEPADAGERDTGTGVNGGGGSGEAGSAASGSATPAGTSQDTGCGCRVPDKSSRNSRGVVLGWLACVLCALRARRRLRG